MDFWKGCIMSVRYDEPHAAAKAANTLIRWLAEIGISIAGTRALRVRGRPMAGGMRDRDDVVAPDVGHCVAGAIHRVGEVGIGIDEQ